MADVEVDIGQLSESQQEPLQQYTNVTNQETKAAVPLLERSQWNVQVPLLLYGHLEAWLTVHSTDRYSQVL